MISRLALVLVLFGLGYATALFWPAALAAAALFAGIVTAELMEPRPVARDRVRDETRF